MTAAQVAELRRCASDARRLLHGDKTPDRKTRLLASAVRVLADASGVAGEESSPDTTIQDPDEYLWNLTLAATALRGQADEFSSIDEAVAALQLLASTLADSAATVPGRIQRLREIDVSASPRIRARHNGPYLLTNAATITDWLGQELIVPPVVALCRCGASTIKPFCDCTHVQNAFDDRKDPKRVADRQDSYNGQQLAVLDNRGTCAHSGFCTERLPAVFHQGQEPFVAPSGARFDEIMRAVRQCPSGALSFCVDGREAREQVDLARSPDIGVSRDGPYRITGGVPLVGDDHAPVSRNAGASLEHYSLCRCGHSQNKPFLQRHALVRALHRSGDRNRPRVDAVRMGWGPARAHPDDSAVLFEIRSRGSVDRAAVREHGPRSP